MLKITIKFKGVKTINKKEQIKVNGGRARIPRNERE